MTLASPWRVGESLGGDVIPWLNAIQSNGQHATIPGEDNRMPKDHLQMVNGVAHCPQQEDEEKEKQVHKLEV